MKKHSFFILLLFMSSLAFGQVARRPVAALYNNLTSYSPKNIDALSFSANTAALGEITQLSAGVYGERRFLLADLALYNAALAVPTNSGTFGITGSYFGSSQNNELQAGLAYGRKLGEKVSVGAGFNYFNVAVQGYGSAAAYNIEAGVMVHLTETVHVGVHAYNPTSSKLGKGEEEFLPSVYTIGLGYDPSERFFVAASLQKVEDENPGFNAGIGYRFDTKLMGRAGFASATSSYYLGLGFQLTSLRLDATASIHPQLGVTPGLQLLFQRKNEKK